MDAFSKVLLLFVVHSCCVLMPVYTKVPDFTNREGVHDFLIELLLLASRGGTNMERAQFFNDSLVHLSLASYKRFQEFKVCATLIKNRLHEFPLELSQDLSNAKLDTVSMDIFPAQEFPDLVPVKVSGDGNCLPRSASMLVFGDQHHHIEMRVRMACELALNKDFYLNDTNHKMYCSNYNLGIDSDKITVEKLFELNAMTTAESGNNCGIWHLYALSSIVGCRLYSIYPKLKSTVTIRLELNRIIFPRKQMSRRTMAIFWTNTDGIKVKSHWRPNHFAPCFQKHFMLKQKQRGVVRRLDLPDKGMKQTPRRSNSLVSLNSQQFEAPTNTTVSRTDTLLVDTSRTHNVTRHETPKNLNMSLPETQEKHTVSFNLGSNCEASGNVVTKKSKKMYIKRLKGGKNPLKNIFKFFTKHHEEYRGPEISWYELECA